MERSLGSGALRDGAPLEMSVLDTPAPERAAELSGFYIHKEERWKHHIDESLRRPMDSLETRFYLGRCEGEVITAITTISSRGVGIVGHVYTEHAHRCRGASSLLFPAMMEDVRALGGRAFYLGTAFGSTAYRIYERSGFASRHPNSGEMEWFAESDDAFLADYFQPAPTSVSAIRWDHWPRLNPLTARKGGGVVSYGLNNGYFSPVAFEYPFLTLKQGLECFPGWDGRVLVSEAGSVVGLATLVPRWEGEGARILDVLVHPAFAAELPAFVRELPLAGPLLAFAAAGEEERIAALEGVGFRMFYRGPHRCRWTGDPPQDRVVLGRRV